MKKLTHSIYHTRSGSGEDPETRAFKSIQVRPPRASGGRLRKSVPPTAWPHPPIQRVAKVRH